MQMRENLKMLSLLRTEAVYLNPNSLGVSWYNGSIVASVY